MPEFDVPPKEWELTRRSEAMLDGVSRWIVDNINDDLPLPELLRKLAKRLEEYVLSCDVCGSVYSHRRSDARFCSLACRSKHYYVDHKRCKRCERVLPKTEFRVCTGNASGLQFWCRPCTREYQRVYRRETEVGRRNKKKHRNQIRNSKSSPIWRDRAKIRAIYAERDRLIKETGIEHHVDHEIPLNGTDVCGLHVHNNLKPITADENIRKGSWFTTT